MASSPKQSRRGARPARADPDASDPNAAAARKPAWTRRPDAPPPPAAGTVMGASSSWPPLSESARTSPRPPSPDPPSEVPAPADQSQKAAGAARQKPARRVQNGIISEDRHLQAEKTAEEARASPRENKGGVTAPFGRGEPPHQHHRNFGANNRRGNNNGGGGGGAHHNSRRDVDRDWNPHPNFGPVHQHRPLQRPPPFIRAPMPMPAQFMAPPPPMQPFGPPPMGYHEMPSVFFVQAPPPPPDAYRGIPYISPPAVFIPPPPPPPPPDPQTQTALLKQIEYYFSPDNLCKDVYLRNNMNAEGWVSVHLIANFNRVKHLTTNIQFILDVVRVSPELEVQGDKIRRRSDWKNWLIHKPQFTSNQGLPDFQVSTLTANIGSMTIGDGAVGQNNARTHAMSRSSSERFDNRFSNPEHSVEMGAGALSQTES